MCLTKLNNTINYTSQNTIFTSLSHSRIVPSGKYYIVTRIEFVKTTLQNFYMITGIMAGKNLMRAR